MEFLELPNKGSVTPLCCGDDGNCEPCYLTGVAITLCVDARQVVKGFVYKS
ncbi:hypothetical protein [Petrotoga sp. HWH.PT.55.6.1]|uniref:hypothetical protein n=1 Tax=Petrotoga sp. HWH.PT.55.6.1 TaxID=1307425 RepID=UPI0013153E81|nr:hypothetical protein [Petrotoga sp. HWH.PT.55.6.1]